MNVNCYFLEKIEDFKDDHCQRTYVRDYYVSQLDDVEYVNSFKDLKEAWNEFQVDYKSLIKVINQDEMTFKFNKAQAREYLEKYYKEFKEKSEKLDFNDFVDADKMEIFFEPFGISKFADVKVIQVKGEKTEICLQSYLYFLRWINSLEDRVLTLVDAYICVS